MIIPEGFTEQEVVDTITRVARRFAARYRFSSYEADDIFQEAFIIGMNGLGKYETGRPLENFLAVVIPNGLKNFKRKIVGRPEDINKDRKLLVSPLSMDIVRDEEESGMWNKFDFLNDLQVDDIFRLIDIHLPVDFRADFLRMKQGILISKPRREKIEYIIVEILRENGYETW